MIALHAVAPLNVRPLVDWWATADGRTILVRELSDNHIISILRLYEPPIARGRLLPSRLRMIEAVQHEANRRGLW